MISAPKCPLATRSAQEAFGSQCSSQMERDMVTPFSSRDRPKKGETGELICDEVSPASEPSKTQEARSKSWSKYSSESVRRLIRRSNEHGVHEE
jgi:hypothetical protein